MEKPTTLPPEDPVALNRLLVHAALDAWLRGIEVFGEDPHCGIEVFGEDPHCGIEVFGEDPHCAIAALMWGVSEKDVTRAQRQLAKWALYTACYSNSGLRVSTSGCCTLTREADNADRQDAADRAYVAEASHALQEAK